MIFLKETTVWSEDTPNHVYLLDDSKGRMIGYVPNGTSKVVLMGTPRGFYVRGRSFVEVQNTFGFNIPVPDVPQWKIKGSKGNEYVVEKLENGYACSCPGFKYHRGHCKHIEQVESGNA